MKTERRVPQSCVTPLPSSILNCALLNLLALLPTKLFAVYQKKPSLQVFIKVPLPEYDIMSKERLLEDYQLEESRIAGFKKAKRWYQLSRPTAVLWVAVVCLITGNIFFYQQARHLRGLKYAGASRFCKLDVTRPVLFC